MEQATAMAYLELLLRCVTSGGLLRVILHFLFTYEYDGVKIIDVLLGRLEGNNHVSIVFVVVITIFVNVDYFGIIIRKFILQFFYLFLRHSVTQQTSELLRAIASTLRLFFHINILILMAEC